MIDYAGKRLIWSSTRNSTNRGELNLFLADFLWSMKNFKNKAKNEYKIKKHKNLGKINQTHFPMEKHLENVQQLTFGGQNAEGYFRYNLIIVVKILKVLTIKVLYYKRRV